MPKRRVPPGWRGVPNVGPAMAADLLRLGFDAVTSVRGHDPDQLYEQLCRMDGVRHDVCVLDTLRAVVDVANGRPPRPWWHYSRQRLARASRQGSKRAKS